MNQVIILSVYPSSLSYFFRQKNFFSFPPLWKQEVYAKRGVGGLFAGVEARMGQAVWQTLFMQVRSATAKRALGH